MTYRTYRKPARTAASRTRSTFFTFSVVVGAALIGLAASPIGVLHGDPMAAITGTDTNQPTTEVLLSDPEAAVIGIESDQPTAEVRGQPDDPEPSVYGVA